MRDRNDGTVPFPNLAWYRVSTESAWGNMGAMKLLLVCGPWGSGTTAVAGLLERLGAVGFGPYFHTRDPRTPNSYELLPFRELVAHFASEATMSLLDGTAEQVEAALRDFRRRIDKNEFGPYDSGSSPPIFLKYPLSALVLPQICRVFETKLISVLRPLAQIERTRLRRNWAARYGEQGAEVIYQHLARVIDAGAYPHLRVKYDELLRSPAYVARRLAHFAELKASREEIERAAAFITRRGS